jgi:S1-C subfamily serine protease
LGRFSCERDFCEHEDGGSHVKAVEPLRKQALSAKRWGATVMVTPVVALTALISGVAAGQGADTLSGSGVVIGTLGEVLTNAHVVENCTKITVRSSSGASAAFLVARDEKNDLAVVRSKLPLPSAVAFREGGPVRAGDAVVALGYPLSGLLATTANLSVGNVSLSQGLVMTRAIFRSAHRCSLVTAADRCLIQAATSSEL